MLASLILLAAATAAGNECLLDDAAQVLAAADCPRVLLGVRRGAGRDTDEKDHHERDESSLDHGFVRAARAHRAALSSCFVEWIPGLCLPGRLCPRRSDRPGRRLRRRRRMRRPVPVNHVLGIRGHPVLVQIEALDLSFSRDAQRARGLDRVHQDHGCGKRR